MFDCWHAAYASKRKASGTAPLQPLASGQPRLAAAVRGRALDALAFCISRGLTACAALIMDLAAANGVGVRDVLQESRLGGCSLLECALKSRRPAALERVLVWAQQSGHVFDLTLPGPGGLNPLQGERCQARRMRLCTWRLL